MSKQQILLATNNQHKIAEIKAILADLSVDLLTPAQVGLLDFVPNEDGQTYQENAAIKARSFAQETNSPVLADDSGVEAAALPGLLGVNSARWQAGSDRDRLLALWHKMQGVSQRTFTYQTVICYLNPSQKLEKFFTGTLHGQLALEPRGHNNFGYDPLMIPDGQPGELKQTLAEMTPAQKNSFSHRAQALQKFVQWYQVFNNQNKTI